MVFPIKTHHEGSTAGFQVRGAHRDAAAPVILEPSGQSSVEQDEGDLCPAPEDEEFFQGLDTESKEEAINKFLDGMEDQERSGFKVDSGYQFGCADTAAADGRWGSNVYEVNPWRWQFGRGKPRLGGLTVKETTERKKAAREGYFKHGWETRRRRNANKA
jgi:hypothetical protein